MLTAGFAATFASITSFTYPPPARYQHTPVALTAPPTHTPVALTAPPTHCKQYTYNAPLNFSASSTTNETIPVRYWVDDTCASTTTTAPLFVQMGGEAAAGCTPCNDLVKKFGGISVAVEHRFYGTSLPLGGLTPNNLVHLTTDNNLEDTRAIIALLNPAGKRRVITHGGSYSGGTASWFRTLYPDVATGSISSSGVVNALVDFIGFDESNVNVLRSYHMYPKCLSTLVAAFDAIDDLSPSQLQALKRHPFNASNLIGTPMGDVDFHYMVADATAMAIQYGNKKALCSAMETGLSVSSASSHPIALLAKFVSDFYGPVFQTQSFYDTKQISLLIHPSQEGVGAKSWRWQKCSQIAYLQSRPLAATLALRSRSLTQENLLKQCESMFPSNKLDLAKTNAVFQTKYGGARPDKVGATKIFYLDYSDDPWQRASVQGDFSKGLELEYCMTICDGCGHCGAGVPRNLTECTDRSVASVGRWLSE